MINGKYDLQNRLIDFAVKIIKIASDLPSDKVGNHIKGQIIRSGTSPAANYGEAQAAESRADFIHKLKISLKELRETDVWLQVIERSQLLQGANKLQPAIHEVNELISIIYKSIETAKNNIKDM